MPTDRPFVVGREADLVVDDNPFLHRRFLDISHSEGMWWLRNIGGGLSVTVSDDEARIHAWLGPGAHLPILFHTTVVRFTAGSTGYEFTLHLADPPFTASPDSEWGEGTTTKRLVFTDDQKRIIVALAEPALRGDGNGRRILPGSAETAARLGWSLTRFNRKLDSVCEKLERAGVRGLHGGPDRLASGRRARLVEYALASRLISSEDLALLDKSAGEASSES